MEPIFDRRGLVRGWLKDDRIFDPTGRPVAFLNGMSVVSYRGREVGKFQSGFLRDLRGGAIAFVRGASRGPVLPVPSVPPVPPVPAVPPVPPVPPVPSVPAVPGLGWSQIGWDQLFGAR